MKTLLLCCTVLLALVPSSAWSTTPCRGQTQAGETFRLELVNVTIDGGEQTDVSAYAPYEVTLSNVVHVDGDDGATQYVELSAERSMLASDGRLLLEGTTEFYLPE